MSALPTAGGGPGGRSCCVHVTLAISYRAAYRALGVRDGTATGLVAAGRLRPIPWGRRFRVLASDLERVAAAGILPDLRKPRAPRRRPTAAGVGARIRALRIPGVTP